MVQDKKEIVRNGFWHINIKEFVCGWTASFVNISVTYPVYKIMFRQVNHEYSRFLDRLTTKQWLLLFIFQILHDVEVKLAVQELRQEGLTFLYRGILPPLAQRTLSLSLMFGLYDGTKQPLVKLGVNEYLARSVAGMTAGE